MSSPASIKIILPKPRRCRRGRSMKLTVSGGLFRHGAESEFPWDARSGVWYYLLEPAGRGLRQVGFRSTLGEKWDLVNALHKAKLGRVHLFGVWTGQWETHLFVLKPKIAIARLEKALNWTKKAVASS